LHVLRPVADPYGRAGAPLESASPRNPQPILEMGRTVQSTLAQILNVLLERGCTPDFESLPVLTKPRTADAAQHVLSSANSIRELSDAELWFKAHETWGRFCLFLWYFHRTSSCEAWDLGPAPALGETRCAASLAAKQTEIHAILWKLRFEKQLRQDSGFRASRDFLRLSSVASRIPVVLRHTTLEACSCDELLAGECEFAGMLATVRWILDSRRNWADADLSDVAIEPFPDCW